MSRVPVTGTRATIAPVPVVTPCECSVEGLGLGVAVRKGVLETS